jgi:hypothetical protein
VLEHLRGYPRAIWVTLARPSQLATWTPAPAALLPFLIPNLAIGTAMMYYLMDSDNWADIPVWVAFRLLMWVVMVPRSSVWRSSWAAAAASSTRSRSRCMSPEWRFADDAAALLLLQDRSGWISRVAHRWSRRRVATRERRSHQHILRDEPAGLAR